MKRQHSLLGGLMILSLLAAACGDDEDTESSGDEGGGGEEFTLGAPPDCEENPFCLPGLEEVYGLDLSANFTALELDLIPPSLEEEAIDVGVFLSTSGQLTDDQYTVLEDDQGLLAADNVAPVASAEVADAYGDDLSGVLDGVSAELTTEVLVELNRSFEIDREDPDTIAEGWLADAGLEADDTPREGPEVKIGAQNFGESAILAQIYAQALTANGFNAGTVEVGGFREILLDAFDSGDVNLSPEYVASLLNTLEEGAATSDVGESMDALAPLLEERGLVAFEPAEAVDTNTFVMLTERAEELDITTLSDLADRAAG